MKLRIAAIAFLLAVLATGITWLSFQPVMLRLVEALRVAAPAGSPSRHVLETAQEFLPLYLGLDLLILVLVAFGVLYFTVARPLRAVEREMLGLERLATVGRLAAGVAHEIGNPLSGVLGWLSVAQTRSAADAELSGYLRELEAEVRRIDGIVRSLLDLGRPARPQLGPVPVAELIRNAARLVGSGPEFREVTVETEVDPEVVALADPGPLSQVVINLLINAAQAIGGPGTIRVVGGAEAGRVRIEVLDSGPGVPAELRDRIFEPFFTTKSGGKGTGLGLAVSQHLMRAMSGDISVGESPHGGGKFTVSLPAA